MKNWIILYYLSKLLKKARLSSIKNSNVHHTSKIESGCNICSVSMGRYSFCGYNCEIINTEIGAFCSIANNVIIGGAMHPVKWGSTSPVFYKGRDSVKMKFSEYKRAVCKILLHFSYSVHLRRKRIIGKKEFVFFEYNIKRMLSSAQIKDYFYDLYHFSKEKNLPFPFGILLEYADENKLFDSNFF